jgi:hypothetical protein
MGRCDDKHRRLWVVIITTQEMIMYAFFICCIEILDKGTMPWQHDDDSAIICFMLGVSEIFVNFFFSPRRQAFSENKRPYLRRALAAQRSQIS